MWQSPFVALPANGQTVWIRVVVQYAEPVQAAYNAITQEFVTVTTSLVVPALQVSKWKPV